MLTRKSKQTFDFIKYFIDKQNLSPTMAEIAKGIGVKSRGVAYRYVQHLVKEGLISLVPGRHRNIELLMPNLDEKIPLLGIIAAGKPIEAVSIPETVDVACLLLGANRYALKVKGDSMVDEGILDGDLVICEHAKTAHNGEIVVALLDNEAVTLKRFYNNEDGTITLKPANALLQAINYPATRITIQGVMIGLLRLSA
ncbi:MAG: repressor LexA [Gammaproteobacteria bacterium RIFCSPHIGHO2_12_FULL_35_23]|nr:MAG: repressor LexA [Gammaproteobacteria bacterium RIFCSPHIGHO2_12_FULL_35_23]